MPTNVVKTADDEEKWKKAKIAASDAGHKNDYAYIMGIYKKMKGEKSKTKSEEISELLTENQTTIDQTIKNIKYKDLEKLVDKTLKENDFKTFNQILTSLYNSDQEKLYVRLLVNYDKNLVLTKSLFNTMKSS